MITKEVLMKRLEDEYGEWLEMELEGDKSSPSIMCQILATKLVRAMDELEYLKKRIRFMEEQNAKSSNPSGLPRLA